MQKLQSSNNPLKETQNPSIHYNSRTNLKFQHNLAKISSFKNPHIKNRPIIIIIIIITINYRNHTWSYPSAKTMLGIRIEAHLHIMLSQC